MVSIIYSDQFLNHKTGRLHPEKPERLTAIVKAIKAASWANQIEWKEPTSLAQRDSLPWVQRVHDAKYIENVKEIADTGGGFIDMDTPVCSQSYEIALLAVNAWCDGVDTGIETGKPVFVLARPPGHHAEKETGMGFCLFSNAAIAAYYALDYPEINRVAIVDWDVHHGNGTQSLVQDSPNIAYCSLHQFPSYPGTGNASESGKFNNVLNIPLSPGSGFSEYQTAFEQKILPFLKNFSPDLLIISAGYDANQDDPLASINLHPEDYGVFTHQCLGVTHRVIMGLEGGYHLRALAQSVLATLQACLKTSLNL